MTLDSAELHTGNISLISTVSFQLIHFFQVVLLVFQENCPRKMREGNVEGNARLIVKFLVLEAAR
jgi:hypothetical protein